LTETGLLMEAATVRERFPPQIPKPFTHPHTKVRIEPGSQHDMMAGTLVQRRRP
jgi:hypothetical protein